MIDDSEKIWVAEPTISKYLLVFLNLQIEKKNGLSYLIFKTLEVLQIKILTIVVMFYQTFASGLVRLFANVSSSLFTSCNKAALLV